MNLTVQRHSTEPFEETVSKKRAARWCAPVSMWSKASVIIRGQPLVCQQEPPPIEIAEGTSEYKVIVPLSGIDPSKVHVLATPQSLLVEVCIKSIVRHPMTGALVTENIVQRISREFSLPVEIERGSTTVQVCGESIQITARKSQYHQQTPWSQLIDFDTRASLGCA